MLVSPTTVLGQVASGALRPLAIAGSARSPLFPDVPTFAEAGYSSVNIESWVGILAPAKTPRPIVARMNSAFNAALTNRDTIAQLTKLGFSPAAPGDPGDLRKRMLDELAAWPKIFDTAGIQREK